MGRIPDSRAWGGRWCKEGDAGLNGQREGGFLLPPNLPNWNSQFRWAQRGLRFGVGCLFVPLLLYFMVIWLKDVYRKYAHTHTHTHTQLKYRFPMGSSSTVLLPWLQLSSCQSRSDFPDHATPPMAGTHSVSLPLLVWHMLRPQGRPRQGTSCPGSPRRAATVNGRKLARCVPKEWSGDPS